MPGIWAHGTKNQPSQDDKAPLAPYLDVDHAKHHPHNPQGEIDYRQDEEEREAAVFLSRKVTCPPPQKKKRKRNANIDQTQTYNRQLREVLSVGKVFDSKDHSPALGANYLESDWFVPKNGTAVLKG